jgi:uncharacterized FlaG/YvyC family protein
VYPRIDPAFRINRPFGRLVVPSALAPFSEERLTMTPEERWIKIEDAILALQAQHEADIRESRWQIAENRKQIAQTDKKIARIGDQMEKKTSQIDAQIEKNTAAIRDLIVVSRTVVNQQQRTEKQLQLLIKAMNAFLRGFQKPNGNQ